MVFKPLKIVGDGSPNGAPKPSWIERPPGKLMPS
jgi:hypothetical protein